MRVVVTSFGSSGDFNPLLAIAAALRQRGDEVSFVANPFYGERVRAVGCDFVPAGRHLDIFAALEARADYFLSAAEAKEYGVVDEVLIKKKDEKKA